jgi:hypothetical protein
MDGPAYRMKILRSDIMCDRKQIWRHDKITAIAIPCAVSQFIYGLFADPICGI